MPAFISASQYLDRALDPLAASLNEEAARSILDLRMGPDVEARVQFLAEKANEGELSPDERDEYASYVDAADFLAIFKLKARRHLEANVDP